MMDRRDTWVTGWLKCNKGQLWPLQLNLAIISLKRYPRAEAVLASTRIQAPTTTSQAGPYPRGPAHRELQAGPHSLKGHGPQRIHLDGPRPGANGHDAKLGVEGQSAGLVGETMFHGLWEREEHLHRHSCPLAYQGLPQGTF